MGLGKIFDIKLDQWVWCEWKKLVMASVLTVLKAWMSRTKAPKMQCPPRVIFPDSIFSMCPCGGSINHGPVASYNALHLPDDTPVTSEPISD